MKTYSIFRLFCGITLLVGLMMQGVYAYSGKDSRNGECHPSQGTIRVLVVFAEVTGDPNYNNSTWPWEAGKMPPDADKLFDTKLFVLGGELVTNDNDRLLLPPIGPGLGLAPTKKITQFYHDASFGNLIVTGDYFPDLVKIPYSNILNGANWDKLVMDVLSKPDSKSASGLKIPADFDAWTPTGDYLEKNNTPDGKIDNLIIIWRVNSRLSTVNGSGHWVSLAQANHAQSIYGYDFLTNVVVPHEFSHGLLGSNQYHNGGAGAGQRHFMTNVGGYGILESYNHNLRSCNAWDRYRLGWKKDKNYPNIYAHDLAGNIVNGNITYRIPTADELKKVATLKTDEYVLRDFITTGDAIRIQLPYLEQGGATVEPQWIWLENHVKDSIRLYYPEGASYPMGVRINLQIGSENFNYVDDSNMWTNYYVPFSRFGRWDFDVSRIPINRVGNGFAPTLPFIPELDSLQVERVDYGDGRV